MPELPEDGVRTASSVPSGHLGQWIVPPGHRADLPAPCNGRDLSAASAVSTKVSPGGCVAFANSGACTVRALRYSRPFARSTDAGDPTEQSSASSIQA